LSVVIVTVTSLDNDYCFVNNIIALIVAITACCAGAIAKATLFLQLPPVDCCSYQ